ncbi:MAG: hypothetical protein DDT40_01278 [candidate division WS2 bacterium]|nr:hypothetical protein [Candidatus Psychracetigena formicireducens]
MIGKFLTLAELFRRFQKIDAVTLLGIGPVSKNTIIASLEVARKYDFPLLFIVSRNQVDKKELGGGYLSGWDQKGFVSGVKRLAERHAFPSVVYFCRDHGGPYQRDKELNQKILHDEAMRLGKASFFADLEAGFDLLHIDPTKNPFLKEATDSLKVIVDDTVNLLASVEERRRRLGLPEITYEVGAEDIKGGLTQAEKFRQFLSRLKHILQHQKLPQPNFIVGQTGTLIKLDTNAGFFHPEVARGLARIARENGAFLEEHNTDYLDEESLRMHPVLGISAANVAPEFGVVETKSLIRISYLTSSGDKFRQVLKEKVFSEDRWQKWLPENLKAIEPRKIKADLTLTYKVVTSCGHYYLEEPEVLAAKKRFFRVLKKKKINPERETIESIKKAIIKYVDAFNLKDLNKRIKDIL